MNKIRAVFFDIDGTLVSFNTHTVPEDTKQALSNLRKAGVKVFVCTGRMLSMINVLNDIEFDGYITYNGACCVDSTKKNIIFKKTIPQKELQALVDRLKWDKFPVSFMTNTNMYVNYLDPLVTTVADLVQLEYPQVKAPEEIIKEDVYQLCIYVDEPKIKEIISEVLPDCHWSRWIEIFADVNINGINKQYGIDRMLEHFNIPLEQAMAFGDGGNDIPMLKHVPYSVAMGNATDNVKQAAKYITQTVDEGGIVNALKHYQIL